MKEWLLRESENGKRDLPKSLTIYVCAVYFETENVFWDVLSFYVITYQHGVF